MTNLSRTVIVFIFGKQNTLPLEVSLDNLVSHLCRANLRENGALDELVFGHLAHKSPALCGVCAWGGGGVHE